MRLFSFIENNGSSGVGLVTDAHSFVSLTDAAPHLPRTLRGILEDPEGLDRVHDVAVNQKYLRDLGTIRFDLLIPEPNAIWCVALNFKAHLVETGLATSRQFPQVFLRMPASVVGHGGDLVCPPPDVAKKFDYEGELAVVIGRGGRHIPVEKAIDHVAGYTICNEGSVREFQGHNRQFGLGKNFEASGSIGPWLMTPDEVGDINAASVTTRLNGVSRQHSRLDDMLFGVDQLIHYLSTGYRLRPGDIIAMGTPGQLRAAGAPTPTTAPGATASSDDSVPNYGAVSMQPGDIVEVEITGLGVLRNSISADRPRRYASE